MNNRLFTINNQIAPRAAHQNQNGSIILIVLLLLVLMSIIGIASTNTTITESFIVRNTAIRNQNVQMADAAAAEVAQIVLDATFVSIADPTAFLTQGDLTPSSPEAEFWVHDKDAWAPVMANWYDPNHIGRILDTTNSQVPDSLIANDSTGVAGVLIDRGEWDSANPDTKKSPIRYALVGWDAVGGTNLDTYGNQVQPRSARILAEYVSDRYGIIRLTVGVIRNFSL